MARKYDSQLESQVAELLKQSGVSFVSQPTVGGLRPDFLITAPDGRRIVIEVKGWVPDHKHTRRAIEQARQYKSATKADEAYVVLPAIEHSNPPTGLLTIGELAQLLAREGVSESVSRREDQLAQEIALQSGASVIFAAMPFTEAYDDVYFVAMAFAAEAVGASCVRVDHEDFEGDIVEEIQRQIRDSAAVIADLSESRPNVMYELGFAHALGKPTVLICSTALQELPFDVRNLNVLQYAAGRTYNLRERLACRLSAALRRTS